LKQEIEFTQNRLERVDALTQINKVKGMFDLIENFEELELEEQIAKLKLIIKEIVYTRTVETKHQPVLDIKWREL
jgi:site-specific DNA recombinase